MEKNLNQTISIDFFGDDLSKSQITKVKILEGAIRAFVKFGLEKATFQRIAHSSSCSYALVKHYFPDREQLFDATVRYIRFQFQKMAIDAFQKESKPEDQLEAYVSSTFEWVREFHDHAQVWLLFFFLCGSHKRYRRLNSEMADMGQSRIAALLKRGSETGAFSRRADQRTAKAIQVAITGALVTLITEDINGAALEKEIVSLCLSMAKRGHRHHI